MNLAKHRDIIDPVYDVTEPIHIIGCGAIGSRLAEMLTRLGLPELHLYDFDVVEPPNITNQLFLHNQLGIEKTTALANILQQINPEIILYLHEKYEEQPLRGYIFMCVDSIETRQLIVENNKYNTNIKTIFDFRMGLYDAQTYTANWNSEKKKKFLMQSMDFTHEEAAQNVPKSPCGTVLSVAPTICTIVSIGVINFLKTVKNIETDSLISINLYTANIITI